MKIKRKAISLLLMSAMVLGLLPLTTVQAAVGGDFTITGSASGYTYLDGVLTFKESGDYTVSMTTPDDTTVTDRIAVNAPTSTEANPVSITLSSISIDVSGIDNACAFEIQGNSIVKLFNVGDNILKSGPHKAGLQVPEGATVTITSTAPLGVDWGLLEVFGGASAAGIGGGWCGDGGTVTIRRTSVYATGGVSIEDLGAGGIGISGAGIGGGAGRTHFPYSGGDGCILTIDDAYVKAFSDGYGGAGIGGGSWGGSGGNFTINSGHVEARGWKEGAGIGGGSNYGGNADGGSVTINGGEVWVYGGYRSAGIGGGYQGNSGTVTISGGRLQIDGGGDGAAGIGGGAQGDGGTIIISGGEIISRGGIGAGNDGNGGTVTITGGWIGTDGGNGAAIGGGGWGKSGSTVTITGGTVLATGGILSAGIGGGFGSKGCSITISGGTVTARGGDNCAGIGGGGGIWGIDNVVVVEGGTVEATGGSNGAGIGGNFEENGGTVTISGGTITANGGSRGAGIGGGQDGDGGTINIQGGTITANGGEFSSGIGGGGDWADGGTVTISGGVVFAKGMNSGQDIGAGGSGSGGTLDISGPAAVFLRNDSSTAPEPSTHEHYDIESWGDSIYGIPVAWSGSYGAYLRLSTLSYDLNGGQGTAAASVTQHIGTTVNIVDESGIYRTGFSFTGWNTQPDGDGTPYAAYSSFTFPQEDTMLYAQWTAVPYVGGVSAPTHNAEVSGTGGTSTLPIAVNTKETSAAVSAGTSHGNALLGGGSVFIKFPAIPNVTRYTLNIPADYLFDSSGGTMIINTDIGSVTLPSNMLTGVLGAAGTNAAITIGLGDKSGLSDTAKAAVGNRPLVQLTMKIDGSQIDWNNPHAPVTFSIPYTPTAEELLNPESIIIWYIDGSGNPVSVPSGRYDPETGTVAFSTTHFSFYAVGFNIANFNDVALGAWYEKAVHFITARGIATGTGNGKYSPEAKLTRGEFLVMMMRAYDISPDANPTDNFADAGNTAYTGYLAAAKRLGISAGVGSNMFAPQTEITRQEMFTLLFQALTAFDKLPLDNVGASLSSFSDARTIAPWAKEAMTLLVQNGIIVGSSGKLSPENTATRSELAQVLYILLSKQH